MTKGKTRAGIQSKDSVSSTVSFIEKKRGTSPEIAQTPRKPKKESRAEQYNLRHSP
jgi:hypothetical protein